MDGPLPTGDDPLLSSSNRRQPALIRNRSDTLLSGLRSRWPSTIDLGDRQEHHRRACAVGTNTRRMSLMPEALETPQTRSMRLLGNSNPRYRWHQYYKSEEELKHMKKHIRSYYERTNFLIAQYLYADSLLDSSTPHGLMQEYNLSSPVSKVRRTPDNIYQLPNESAPMLYDDNEHDSASEDWDRLPMIDYETTDPSERVVVIALYIHIVANFLILGGKIAATWTTGSLSIMASLVRTALDCLSTVIVWTTIRLVTQHDQYGYPVGRRRLQPVAFLVFSVIMVTAFFLVALECLIRLISGDQTLVRVGGPAIGIMFGTIVIKSFVWLWCRLMKSPSIRALAQDALSAVVFDLFSIIIPIIGFYAKIWGVDAVGGILLSLSVMFSWTSTSSEHIRNLTGAAAAADERSILLYLIMRFAKAIKYIQNIQAYHAGDKLNVEVDIVLDENTSLRDSHDLGESLQYVLESVPTVDRAYVSLDYSSWNLPSHMGHA